MMPLGTAGGCVRAASKLIMALLAIAAAIAVGAAPASAAKPWWHISSETSPTNLQPGKEGLVVVLLSNLGDAPIDASTTPVVVSGALPAGLTATEVTAVARLGQSECNTSSVSCTYKGVLNPYEQLAIDIKVQVAPLPATTLFDRVSVEGGGASSISGSVAVPISSSPPSFGAAEYEVEPFGEEGSPATQAGSHPFELTTSLTISQGGRQPVQLPKDLTFHLPPGLIGNPTAVSQCTMANFFALVVETNLCSPASVVGVATVVVNEPNTGIIFKTVPVFNLVPAQGEPARFGFEVLGKVPIVIDTSVRSEGDYGVDVSVKNATETAGLLSTQVSFWGVPGDPRHNSVRGWECVAGGFFAKQAGKPCPNSNTGLEEKPLLTLPSSCADPTVEPVSFPMSMDSWAEPEHAADTTYDWTGPDGEGLGFTGCGSLPFSPSIGVEPEVHSAASPTGLDVDVTVPQQGLLEPEAVAEADIRGTSVTLPAGLELSPAAANGLVGCPEREAGGFEGVGFTGFAKFRADEPNPETTTFTRTFRFEEEEVEGQRLPPSCPEGSKVGTVAIETPLLANKLEGYVYLAEPAPNGEPDKNPFGSLVALYIVARDPVSGVLVKLAGEGVLSEQSLRVTTVFRNAPPVPFTDLKLHLFGGPRASVTTPAMCGGYTTDAVFTPWSGTGPVSVEGPAERFQIASGVGGGSCPEGTLPFAPGFGAFSTTAQADAFTGFQLELTRRDGDQALQGLSVHLPPGVAAMLSSIELCSEAQAAASACPAGSEVGHVTAVAGLGSEPFVQEGGRVFVTGPYGGAPFGLEIVTPAKAGPFDLGYITVRSKFYVDPNNASVTIVSDPLPTQIRGIPLQLKRVLVTIDRQNFEFNPTNCNPMQITATIGGDQGASANVASPFQVGGCEGLPFHPSFSVSVTGHNSKANGAGLTVRVGSSFGQANIGKARVELPSTLPARLTTIQKACVDHVFEANPASCPEGSLVGSATVHTPVLRSALTGPAYLVSHGAAAFPDLEFVLQGEGITLILDGQTQIKKGVTSSTFQSVPDAPVTSFETVLPQGPHSALTTNLTASAKYSMCGQKLSIPTVLGGQNGALIERSTRVTVEGCAAVKAAKARKLTNAQKLANALKACRNKHKHNTHTRARCEKRARQRYPLAGKARKHARARRRAGKR